MKPKIFLSLAAALALTALPDAALAKPKGCPPGLAKKSPECVPPGLAKKGVSRSEYDERRRGDDDDDYVYDRYRRGDRLPEDRYVVLHEGDRVIFDGKDYVVVDTDGGTVLRRGDDWYRLPRDADSEYVRIGDAIVRVNRKTKAVIELIELADLILN